MNKKRRKIISWIMLISWMAFIFFMSHQPGDISSEYSDLVVKIFTALGLDFNNYFGELATFIVRKVAHFTEYFILYILFYKVIILYINKRKARILALLLVFLYACSDEFHQYFIPGRGPAFKDVMIDTSGGFVASLFVTLIENIMIKYKKQPKSK